MRGNEIAAAFDFLLRLKGWKVSDLARPAQLSVRETNAVVKGKPSTTQTLRQVCDALGFPLWIFWWVGAVTSAPADSRDLEDLWPQLEGAATLHRRKGLELVKEGMVLLLVETGARPGRTKPRPKKAEVRAAWMRINEHAEALRLMTAELVDLSEGRPPTSPDLLDRLASHGVGVWQAVSDLESLGRALAETTVDE
jgi:DNA-binding Xre family transcriptional regulator